MAASALLLFLLQPIIAKVMLPHFGGTTAIWVTASVMFQALLLCGYLYAYSLIAFFSPVTRRRLHVALLTCSLPALLILLRAKDISFAYSAQSGLVTGVSYVVLVCCGAPFILLSATTPLLVAANVNSLGHRLFAYSNWGSFLALAVMPLALEPWIGLLGQTGLWIVAYLVTAVLISLSLWRANSGPVISSLMSVRQSGFRHLKVQVQFGWFGWSAMGAAFLAATNLAMTSLTPGATLVWMIPLAAYLLSFVVAFAPRRYARARLFPWIIVSASVLALLIVSKSGLAHIFFVAIFLFPLCLFGVTCFCHGELALMQPTDQQSIGLYYVTIAFGGVVGGSLVGLGAPSLLPFPTELSFVLLMFGVVLVPFSLRHLPRGVALVPTIFLIGMVWVYRTSIDEFKEGLVISKRNHYGMLRVIDRPNSLGTQRLLVLGSTIHGVQFLESPRRSLATAYFGPESGVARAIQTLRAKKEGGTRPIKIGVVGLGAGVVAAHCQSGDTCDFFDINQAVVDVAVGQFSFLEDAHQRGVKLNLYVGDGRKLFESMPVQEEYDLVVLDVYCDGMIPVHILTKEGIIAFTRHLTQGGILAVNISSTTFELEGIIAKVAMSLGMFSSNVNDVESRRGKVKSQLDETYPSNWMLISSNSSSVEDIGKSIPPEDVIAATLWTDDHVHVLGALPAVLQIKKSLFTSR